MTFGIVVLDKFPNDQPKVGLAEGDDVVEAFASNGADEAFRKGIQIGAPSGQPNGLDSSITEYARELVSKQRVAVVDEVAVLAQEAVERVCQVAGDLFEELSAGLRRDVRDLDPAGLKIHDEKHEVAHEARSISPCILSRPGFRWVEPSYFLATMRRYRRIKVSGVTMLAN